MMENVTYDELEIGRSASATHLVSTRDILLFAAVSGDVNPAHLDADYAEASMFKGVIAHGMLSAGWVSALLGTTLPGPGTIYLQQDLRFCRPVRPGDTVTVTVTVAAKNDEKKQITFDCRCTNQAGKDVILGTALVIAPAEKIRRPRPQLPTVRIDATL
ncbi:3-hydroxybutyryl-CoA dehydratase [Siculibacillus lacustris]|uniref:3-hydroxybutyryl-CoA dehydratase n=2 Tax=Siculibacillus lacustris TaxID=1549641 RepID=A0A4Q9VL22_9HYPH|nr:3-hydroxybutyryl-CoA dehydratase [Siculibacillus lacustris]